jgi:hypothetical protein
MNLHANDSKLWKIVFDKTKDVLKFSEVSVENYWLVINPCIKCEQYFLSFVHIVGES